MKSRQGFVSNSSSSSFVVAWPKKPKTSEFISTTLFGEAVTYPNPYPWDNCPTSFPVSEVSDWLLTNLNWGQKKVRDSLVQDLESDISYMLTQIAEKRTNSYTFEGDEMVSCLTLARREIKQILELLKERYPRVSWDSRFHDLVEYRRKWEKISETLRDELIKVEKELRIKHGCPHIPYKNTDKMTKEEKDAYLRDCDDNYVQFKNKVLEDPKYKAIREKQHRAWRKQYDSKKAKETLSLAANRLADIFYADNQGSVFSVVEIHDDSMLGSAMEHGELFSRLPHKKFSHH